jgi:hypothetical protein
MRKYSIAWPRCLLGCQALAQRQPRSSLPLRIPGSGGREILAALRPGPRISRRPSTMGMARYVRSAAGKLYLQKPGRFRWDYSEPSEQLILADGKQIWFYDKDLQQANVRNMDAVWPALRRCCYRAGDR